MEGRAEQGCSVQPLNFLLQWAWRFRCWGFGQTCLLYLFSAFLLPASFPRFLTAAGKGFLPFPIARPQALAALGPVCRQHMHLVPGLCCCCCCSFCQRLRGLLSILPAPWKALEAEGRGSGQCRCLLSVQRAIYTRNQVAGLWGATAPGKLAWCMWAQSQSMQFRGNV